MIDTINISLPTQLKQEAAALISKGHFASFSDLVRTALRKLLAESKYDLWAQEAKEEYEQGETKALKNKAEIKEFINSLVP